MFYSALREIQSINISTNRKSVQLYTSSSDVGWGGCTSYATDDKRD